MKILNGKNKLKKFIKKGLLYVIICYLLASWGVNGVINPIHYYRNLVMQEKLIELPLNDKGLQLEWKGDAENFNYVSFEVTDAKNFYNDILVNVYSDDELLQSVTVKLYKGLNSLEIQENSTSISISSEVIEKNQLEISNFVLSEYRKVDTGKMIETFFSMLFLLIIWECIQYIKNRYAK